MLIYLLVIIGIVLIIVGVIAIEPMAKLLGADESILQDCITYGRTLLLFLVPFCLQNAFESFLIVAEKPTLGLVVSIIAGICNMALDFLSMYVFKMGVFGAAPIVGYHYGAENKEELKSLLKKSIILIAVTSVVMTGLAELLSLFVSIMFFIKNMNMHN